MIERRKLEEIEFHDRLRALYETDREKYAHQTENYKFYSVTSRSREYVDVLIQEQCRGRRVVVYGSGGGGVAIEIARIGREVVGIDISPESVRLSRERASGVSNLTFEVMDCEALELPPRSFEVLVETGVLHHLDLSRAYPEMARVLSPTGTAICVEALGHNPLIRVYRMMTPHLRTPWEAEHILSRDDIALATQWCSFAHLRFFHLVVLAAVPLR